MMDLNDLTVFAEVVRQGSFTSAARKLERPKSSVSRAVTRLEGELGVRLLQRTTRAVALTSAGTELFSRLAPQLEALRETVNGLPEQGEVPRGHLRLTAASDFGAAVLVPIIARFRQRYPMVTIETLLTNRAVNLAQEGVDLAFRISLGPLKASSLVIRKLAALHTALFASPAWLSRRTAPKTPEELAAHDFVGLATPQLWLDGPSGRVRVKPNPVLSTDDMFFARECLRQGLGIGLLPNFLANEDVASGRLIRVLPRWSLGVGQINLVYPSRTHLPAKTKAFVEHVVEAFRAHPMG